MKQFCRILLVLFVLSAIIASSSDSQVEGACRSCPRVCKGAGKCINNNCKCYGKRNIYQENAEYK
uniref:AKTx n=1 Tax=Centruroides hentzi TaxID=88313 RepID=A0A2I9LNQ4_9SCOR